MSSRLRENALVLPRVLPSEVLTPPAGSDALFIDSTDGRYKFKNESGVVDDIASPPPAEIANMRMTGNGSVTIIPSTNTWVKVNGTTVLENAQTFTMPQNNRLQYGGLSASRVICRVQYNGERSGSNGFRFYEFTVFKNGVLEAGTALMTSEMTNRMTAQGLITGNLTLNTGDYVELFVRNISNNANILVEDICFECEVKN